MPRKECRVDDCNNVRPKGRTICHKCRSRQYKEDHPFRYFYNSHKHNAQDRHLKWTITFAQFRQLWLDSGHWKDKLNGEPWSINRININRGYHIDNVEITPVVLNVQLFWEEQRWEVDFRWREAWSKRNNKPIDDCPF
jgi:hypothetical protein